MGGTLIPGCVCVGQTWHLKRNAELGKAFWFLKDEGHVIRHCLSSDCSATLTLKWNNKVFKDIKSIHRLQFYVLKVPGDINTRHWECKTWNRSTRTYSSRVSHLRGQSWAADSEPLPHTDLTDEAAVLGLVETAAFTGEHEGAKCNTCNGSCSMWCWGGGLMLSIALHVQLQHSGWLQFFSVSARVSIFFLFTLFHYPAEWLLNSLTNVSSVSENHCCMLLNKLQPCFMFPSHKWGLLDTSPTILTSLQLLHSIKKI